METTRGQHGPFRFITVSGLAGWSILGFVPAVIAAVITALIFPKGSILIFVVYYSIFSAWPFLWVRRKFRRHNLRFSDLMGKMPDEKNWLSWIGLVAALLIFSCGSTFFIWRLVSSLAPWYFEKLLSNSSRILQDGIKWRYDYLAAQIIIMVAAAPVVEEILFRGIVLHRWALKWGVRRGVIFSSILFGLLHINPFSTALFGFVVAIVYIKTKSLWPSIIMHSIFNFATILINMSAISWGNITSTPEAFRAGFMLPAILLILSMPWAVYYIVKNWPQNDWSMPYTPEPPAPPSLPPECASSGGLPDVEQAFE